MSSSKSIEQLYQIIRSNYGKTKAKNTVMAILGNILDDLETEGLEVSEQNVSLRLATKAKDFEEASKTKVA